MVLDDVWSSAAADNISAPQTFHIIFVLNSMSAVIEVCLGSSSTTTLYSSFVR